MSCAQCCLKPESEGRSFTSISNSVRFKSPIKKLFIRDANVSELAVQCAIRVVNGPRTDIIPTDL